MREVRDGVSEGGWIGGKCFIVLAIAIFAARVIGFLGAGGFGWTAR